VSIAIEKSTNQLYYYENGILQRTFPVATGRQQSYTPEGNFTVVTKMVNPYYVKANIPGGSPNNPLGYRWIGLSVGGGSVYGIHGTNVPSSIGTYASSGCVRMHNEDSYWLYDHTPIGTPVLIAQTIEHPKPEPQKPVTIALGENKVVVQQPIGVAANGTPLLPLKTVFELLGYSITWNSDTETITAVRREEQIIIDCANGKVFVGEISFDCPELTLYEGSANAPMYLWKQAVPWLEPAWDAEQRLFNCYIKA